MKMWQKTLPLAMILILPTLLLVTPAKCAGLYRSYDVFIAAFKDFANAYPGLVSFESIGKTVQNRDILMFRIGNPAGDRVLFDGAIHGYESLGGELLFAYAQWLVTSNDPIAVETRLKCCTLLIPAFNTDGYNLWRTNAHGVDLNRNFATGWESAGSTDPTNPDYRGPAPLSEPESQALIKVFQTYKPRFYVNLHHGGGQAIVGSRYANASYYSWLFNRMDSLSNARGVAPYYHGISSYPGFSMTDAAKMGITSFLWELANWTPTISLSDVESLVLPRFIPVAAVLSQECRNLFEDGFETGDFSVWSGTMTSENESATVEDHTSFDNTHIAKFSSNGNSPFEYAFCYKTYSSFSEMHASGSFRLTSSGITSNDDRFYLIALKSGRDGVAYAGWRQLAGTIKWNLLVRNGTNWASAYSEVSPSLNTWYFVELFLNKDPSNVHAELYVNGILMGSLSNVNTTIQGENQIRFGLTELYNCGSTTVNCDNCTVDTTSVARRETLSGDINGDGSIDIYDALIAAHAFGSSPGDVNWNPLADLNQDNNVDIYDLIILNTQVGSTPIIQ
jgi:hypothetical protein